MSTSSTSRSVPNGTLAVDALRPLVDIDRARGRTPAVRVALDEDLQLPAELLSGRDARRPDTGRRIVCCAAADIAVDSPTHRATCQRPPVPFRRSDSFLPPRGHPSGGGTCRSTTGPARTIPIRHSMITPRVGPDTTATGSLDHDSTGAGSATRDGRGRVQRAWPLAAPQRRRNGRDQDDDRGSTESPDPSRSRSRVSNSPAATGQLNWAPPPPPLPPPSAARRRQPDLDQGRHRGRAQHATDLTCGVVHTRSRSGLSWREIPGGGIG